MPQGANLKCFKQSSIYSIFFYFYLFDFILFEKYILQVQILNLMKTQIFKIRSVYVKIKSIKKFCRFGTKETLINEFFFFL